MVPEDCLMNKVIVITGPTAVGKTAFSLGVAKFLNTEIINCDASQFRRGLNIGTAKINLEETDVVHHLIDFLDTEAEFSIKDFQALAREKIAALHKRGLIPILVGGSGLYINAVLGDYDFSLPGRDFEFENQYQDYDNQKLHDVLSKLDAEAALKIHPNNRRRVLRAIAAALAGKKISENLKGKKLLYDALIICLLTDRKLLYKRIDARVTEMIEDGWLEEVKTLKEQGVDFQKVKDIGYRELAEYLDIGGALDEVLDDIRRQTRNYAKRQITWFKNKMDCHYISVNYEKPQETEKQIKDLIADFLKK
jgi:tRNA dimethylallyltransferase